MGDIRMPEERAHQFGIVADFGKLRGHALLRFFVLVQWPARMACTFGVAQRACPLTGERKVRGGKPPSPYPATQWRKEGRWWSYQQPSRYVAIRK